MSKIAITFIVFVIVGITVVVLNLCIFKVNFIETNSTLDLRKTETLDEPQSTKGNISSRSSRNPIRCGRPLRSYDGRIVGGKPAVISDFPWIVSLQKERSHWFGFKTYKHSCGGSLITSSWIISAAHCLYNKDDSFRVVAGVDNMNFMYSAQIRMVAKVIIHQEFDEASFNNDIALIKTDRPFDLRSALSHVEPICYEPDVRVETYDVLTVAGFGAKAFRKSTRSHLYKTDIAIIDQRLCNQSFDYRITNNMICAGGMIKNKRDACTGDSGGPLEIELEDHISLIGVVSFGNDCATEGYPGVYTRLGNYYNWVVDIIDEKLAKV